MSTWTALTHQPSFSASTMLLLTDGSVIVQEEAGKRWWKLTPDTTGSYVNGSWSALADMANTREYYASAVLADGRVVVAGGEYSDAGGDTDKAEIYDPLANSWTAIGNPGWGQIGDAAACLLTDGRLLVGNLSDPRCALYNPATNAWTATGSMAARSNEETWTLLPDGTVVTVSCANHPHAEKYLPASGQWVTAGQTPVELVQASSIEIGPAVLMPDGRVFCVGATGHTAIYTRPTNPADPGSWTAGPDFPKDSQGRLLKAKDAPGSLLPNGRVLCVAGPCGDGANDWASPTMFFEFDGVNLIRVTDPPNAGGVTYEGRLLLLPTGQVLFAAGTPAIYVYTPDGGPAPAWKPTITNYPGNVQFGGTYTIQGRQFNGLSQAVSYGDDAQQATNYPLVRVRRIADNSISYWRTANHSTMGVATGSAIVSTTFKVPTGIPEGAYEIAVIANGIASDPVGISVDAGYGQASYLLVDRYFGGGARLWAYVAGNWHGKDVSAADLAGIAQDLFAANRVDCWWSSGDLTVIRGWKNE
jgi:Kelch motif